VGGGGRASPRPAGRRAQSRLPERSSRGPARAGGLSPLLLTMVGQHSVPELLSAPRALSAVDELRRRGSALLRDAETVIAALRRFAAGRGGGGPRGRAPGAGRRPSTSRSGAVEGGPHPRRGGGARRDLSLLRNAAKVREALQAADDALRRRRTRRSHRWRSPSRACGRRPRSTRGSWNRRAAPLRPRGGAGSLPGARIPRGQCDRGSRAAGARRGAAERDPRLKPEVWQGGSRAPFPPPISCGRSGRRWPGRSRGGAAAEGARRRGGGRGRGGEEASRRAGRRRRRWARRWKRSSRGSRSPGRVSGPRFLPRGDPRGAVRRRDRRGGATLLREPRPGTSTARADRLGRELSRVMLSLRNAPPGGAQGKTLVFDEIDTGIGGQVAERVGARLKSLASSAQVVCVTHLPQVAAFADHHLQVVKKRRPERSATGVKPAVETG